MKIPVIRENECSQMIEMLKESKNFVLCVGGVYYKLSRMTPAQIYRFHERNKE